MDVVEKILNDLRRGGYLTHSAHFTMKKHTISFRVYYEDTDVGGIVYHANYLKFAERARTEWLRELGLEQSKLLEEGLAFTVHHLEITFHASAKLDDLLTIETTVQHFKKVSMKMHQTIKCGAKPLVSLAVSIACVNPQGKPARLPALLT